MKGVAEEYLGLASKQAKGQHTHQSAKAKGVRTMVEAMFNKSNTA
jgi:hypothetical protein